jgi:hypothetical protein
MDDFRDFLSQIWVDNTEEEAEAIWRRRVELNPWWSEQALQSVDAVLADPPPDLREQLQEHGWISLYHHVDRDTVRPYSQAETVEWLRGVAERFRAIYERANAGG